MMTKLYNLSYFAVCDFKNTPLEVMQHFFQLRSLLVKKWMRHSFWS